MPSIADVSAGMEEVLSDTEVNDVLVEFQEEDPGIEFANWGGPKVHYNITEIEAQELKDKLENELDLSVDARGDVYITFKWDANLSLEDHVSKFKQILSVLQLESDDITSVTRKSL